ncbi:NAD-dependent epimerase/dehydratase family protein [Nonomuraea sp. B19D2]|uniref:NAD-dependent epimerase/dehydratase family protein n=1 Tax=Nonomuraea sp. B19D2 TaxID=3159561 RepID=UPI0032D9D1E3
MVTGAQGFIGRNLCKSLVDHGIAITRVDNLSVTPVVAPPGDFNPISVEDLKPADLSCTDLVFHLAAHKSVPLSFNQKSAERNLTADHHLLRIAGEAGVPRIFIASSCEVYGEAGGALNSEEDLAAPRSPYAVSKLAAEHLARVYSSIYKDSRFTALRFFNVYGWDEGRDAVIPGFVTCALEGRPLQIEGDGEQRRDFSHIDDIIRVLMRIINCSELPPILNIGSGRSYSVNEVMKIIGSLCPEIIVNWTLGRVNEITEFRADTSTLRGLLGGSQPGRSLKTGIAQVMNQIRESGQPG